MHTDISLHDDIAIWGSHWSCRAAGALLGLLRTNIDSMCLELLLKLLLELLLVLLLQLSSEPCIISIQLLLALIMLLLLLLLLALGNSSKKGIVVHLGGTGKLLEKRSLQSSFHRVDGVGELEVLLLPPCKRYTDTLY